MPLVLQETKARGTCKQQAHNYCQGDKCSHGDNHSSGLHTDYPGLSAALSPSTSGQCCELGSSFLFYREGKWNWEVKLTCPGSQLGIAFSGMLLTPTNKLRGAGTQGCHSVPGAIGDRAPPIFWLSHSQCGTLIFLLVNLWLLDPHPA